MIKVLLVDDEHQYLDETYELGKDYGVDLADRCKSLEKAKEYLKTHEKYQAIICDANFYEKESDTEPKEGADCLIKLYAYMTKNHIELKVFVLSGRVADPSFKGRKENIKNLFEKTYTKKKIKGPESITELFTDLKEHYNNLETIKIKKRFKKAIEMCDLIGGTTTTTLINQIKNMDNNQDINTNKLRTVLDDLYSYFVKQNYAPKGMNPAGVSNFIMGKESFSKQNGEKNFYKISIEQQLPNLMRTIGFALWMLLNKDSHGKETRKDFRDDRAYSPYHENDPEKLLSNQFSRKGIIYMLCEYLVFMKGFFDAKLPREQWRKVFPKAQG